MDSPRTKLGSELQLMRPQWQVVASERTVDLGDRIVLQLSQRTIARSGITGTGVHAITVLATLSVPGTDPEQAEDTLDTAIDELLFDLDAARILWADCSKGRTGDDPGRLCYQLTITITTDRND